MTNFFDCFCIRHNNNQPRRRSHNLPSSSIITNEQVGQKIRLSSLFTDQDKEECSTAENRSGIHHEIVNEARFLKACGTLPETPAEIRKTVSFAANLEKSDKQRSNSKVNSSPKTPGLIKEAESPSSSSLCIPPATLDSSPTTPEEIAKPETSAANSEELELQRTCNVLKSSPYPTPAKITDDMQTPGTVFATNMANLAKGNARIRSQYVHTTVDPIENQSQQQGLEHENSEQGSVTPCSSGPSDGDSSKDNNVEASLSSWLKPPLAYNDAASYKKPNTKKTLGDRPIIGLVGTHWKEEEEVVHISPKWWDGNGIPNSTTKYKEDQKVRWHATPFEERLEKALSEETSISQGKSITGAPIMFDEIEGHDTATSQLQSLNCAKSVVSF